MNREAFEARLQELLDRRRSPASDAELLRAAEADPELGRLLQAFELCSAIRIPRPQPSADLAARVVDACVGKSAVERRLPPWIAPVVAVAATLLVATTVSLLSHRAGDAPMEAHSPTAAAVAENRQPADRDLPRLGRQAAANYRELAATTGQSLTTALSVVQPAARAERNESTTGRSEDDWLRRVPDGLRPLSSSTSGAVYSLMRVVPGIERTDQDEL